MKTIEVLRAYITIAIAARTACDRERAGSDDFRENGLGRGRIERRRVVMRWRKERDQMRAHNMNVPCYSFCARRTLQYMVHHVDTVALKLNRYVVFHGVCAD